MRLSCVIDINPGPKQSLCKKFSIGHWNLNIITSHDFAKAKLLAAYNTLHNFDIHSFDIHILIYLNSISVIKW